MDAARKRLLQRLADPKTQKLIAKKRKQLDRNERRAKSRASLKSKLIDPNFVTE